MAKFSSYIICTSPRSGSTLLCNLLAQTTIAGYPESFFHRTSISSWLDAFELTASVNSIEADTLRIIVQAAIAKGRRDTGMFGLRLQRSSAEFLFQKLGILNPECLNDADRCHSAFGQTAFVYLTRLNKIEQAVSLVKAQQTGLWHIASNGSELERQSPPCAPVYNSDSIMARVKELTDYDRQWENWFVSERLNPVRITYEDLSEWPRKSLARVLESIGLDAGVASGIVPGVGKLANDVNHEWAARFQSEYPGVGPCVQA